MNVAFLTLGCRVNQSEIDVLKESLEHAGINIVSLNEFHDFCIINTCSVTQKSDQTSRQSIRKACRRGAKVIVTGCFSQLHKQEVAAMPGVFKVVDIYEKNNILQLISGSENNRIDYAVSSRSRPFLKVQDGCNFSCTYCTVPMARGKSRSEPLDQLLTRAASIIEKGGSEIVLTGVHLGSYGKDLNPQTDLCNLLRKLLTYTNIYRLRLSSLEVTEINDDLLDALRDNRICQNLHIPLQSGNDKILRLMKRGYDRAYFLSKIERVSHVLGKIGLGTDVIVGFPGEKDSDFRDTLNLLMTLPFTYFHIFPYSPRPGTLAETMKERPTPSVVKERIEQLRQLEQSKKEIYMREQLGKNIEIIIEEGEMDGMVIGTSSNYLKVSIPSSKLKPGSLEIAQPISIVNNMLEGRLIKIA